MTRERSILMNAPMVRASLEGRKKMTRRVIRHGKFTPQSMSREKLYKMVNTLNNKPFFGAGFYKDSDVFEHEGEILTDAVYFKCPYGQPGERLWVRETFLYDDFMHDKTAGVPDLPGGRFSHRLVYRASQPDYPITVGSEKWRSSIYMPRWASRITLEIENVRVERLNDISEEDAKSEGVNWYPSLKPIAMFQDLWRSINGPDSWRANPWVWVIEFKRVEAQS